MNSKKYLIFKKIKTNVLSLKMLKVWNKRKKESIPFFGINSLSSPFVVEPVSKCSQSCALWLTLPIASSSATKDVVTLTSGNIAILDTWLNRAIETPTAASSTGPVWIKATPLISFCNNKHYIQNKSMITSRIIFDFLVHAYNLKKVHGCNNKT